MTHLLVLTKWLNHIVVLFNELRIFCDRKTCLTIYVFTILTSEQAFYWLITCNSLKCYKNYLINFLFQAILVNSFKIIFFPGHGSFFNGLTEIETVWSSTCLGCLFPFNMRSITYAWNINLKALYAISNSTTL